MEARTSWLLLFLELRGGLTEGFVGFGWDDVGEMHRELILAAPGQSATEETSVSSTRASPKTGYDPVEKRMTTGRKERPSGWAASAGMPVRGERYEEEHSNWEQGEAE